MPHRNVWIRKEDLEAWDAIENLPVWLHEKLTEAPSSKLKEATRQTHARESRREDPKPTPSKASEGSAKISESRLGNGFCKIHGIPLTRQGKCLQKGCKYS